MTVLKTIMHNISLFFDKKSDKPAKYPIRLTDNEKKFLIGILQESNNYLEFGSGGSTFLASIYSKTNIISVESDRNWINYISEWNVLKNNKKLKFLHVNIGNTGEWGFPIDIENNRNSFPDYSKKAFDYKNSFDTVFIDGRFRVACILQTILNCSKNTKVLVHDFTFRPEYHCILKFMEIERTVDSLVLLKQRSNIDNNAVEAMWQQYKYIFD